MKEFDINDLSALERKELQMIWNGLTNYGENEMTYIKYLEAGLEIIKILKPREAPKKDFNLSLELLRDLHDLQNGAPLIKYEDDWNKAMEQIHLFLEKHEPPTQ